MILKGCRRQQSYLVPMWERVCFLCLDQGCQWPLSVLAVGQKERIINGDCISNCSTYLISFFWPPCSKTCLILLVECYELHVLLNIMFSYSTCPVCIILLLQTPFFLRASLCSSSSVSVAKKELISWVLCPEVTCTY